MYPNRIRKQIMTKISLLSETAHKEIFKILKATNIPFTQNSNGMFFNFSLVDDATVKQIDDFVEFCLKNESQLDEYDQKLNECKISKNYSVMFPKLTNNADGESIDGDTASQQVNKPISRNLTDVINEQSKKAPKNDWQKLLQETKTTEKLTSFVNMLEDNLEKIVKKRVNTKYINAKKKYSRRVAVDKKFDGDGSNVLITENYLVGVECM